MDNKVKSFKCPPAKQLLVKRVSRALGMHIPACSNLSISKDGQKPDSIVMRSYSGTSNFFIFKLKDIHISPNGELLPMSCPVKISPLGKPWIDIGGCTFGMRSRLKGGTFNHQRARRLIEQYKTRLNAARKP